MAEETDNNGSPPVASVPNGSPSEARPVDLGLLEGKAMAFAPTSALAPEGPPIGGLQPAGPTAGVEPAGDGAGGPNKATAGGGGEPPISAGGQDSGTAQGG
jgi:hypothetical protein